MDHSATHLHPREKAGISPDLITPEQESRIFWAYLEILPGFYRELVFPCPRGCCSLFFLVSCLCWAETCKCSRGLSSLQASQRVPAALPVPLPSVPAHREVTALLLPVSGSLAKGAAQVALCPAGEPPAPRMDKEPSVSWLCHHRKHHTSFGAK